MFFNLLEPQLLCLSNGGTIVFLSGLLQRLDMMYVNHMTHLHYSTKLLLFCSFISQLTLCPSFHTFLYSQINVASQVSSLRKTTGY